ncbi:MAG TPA: restriction endonuclease subunit S [Rectinemataceae bacterium]|nr:restriction endonuclease subunit S [Rectinemataceae bacterium]
MKVEQNKQGLVPKLRFPEFQSEPDWGEKKLGDISIPIEERAGGIKYTLMSVTTGVGLVSQMDKFGREIAGNAYKNYYVILKGDFAYNKSATKQYPEGYISQLIDYDSAALPNSIFTCFRITALNAYSQFFNQLFQANFHGKWLKKFITIGARAHGSLNVDSDDLFCMPINLPQYDEQQKIADCLSSLDELITAHNKKLDNLKLHKNGLMQQLFPSVGETVPRLRFPEFWDMEDWQEKKAGSLFMNRIEAGEAGLPIYSMTMSEGMIERSLLDREFDDIAKPEGNKKAHKNDIVYTNTCISKIT